MPKILSDSKYAELQGKADSYNEVVKAVFAYNEGVKEEEITQEMVLEVISMNTSEGGSAEKLSELQTKYDALQEQNTQLTTKVEELEEQNANLKGSPGKKPATVISDKEEIDAEKQTIADFADKNKGNTQAILNMAKEEGLI